MGCMFFVGLIFCGSMYFVGFCGMYVLCGSDILWVNVLCRVLWDVRSLWV